MASSSSPAESSSQMVMEREFVPTKGQAMQQLLFNQKQTQANIFQQTPNYTAIVDNMSKEVLNNAAATKSFKKAVANLTKAATTTQQVLQIQPSYQEFLQENGVKLTSNIAMIPREIQSSVESVLYRKLLKTGQSRIKTSKQLVKLLYKDDPQIKRIVMRIIKLVKMHNGVYKGYGPGYTLNYIKQRAETNKARALGAPTALLSKAKNVYSKYNTTNVAEIQNKQKQNIESGINKAKQMMLANIAKSKYNFNDYKINYFNTFESEQSKLKVLNETRNKLMTQFREEFAPVELGLQTPTAENIANVIKAAKRNVLTAGPYTPYDELSFEQNLKTLPVPPREQAAIGPGGG